MSELYSEEDVLNAREPILANFHPPTTLKPSWHIRPDEMARAVLDAVAPAIASRALREFADNHVGVQTPARMAEDLHARADEIANGRI